VLALENGVVALETYVAGTYPAALSSEITFSMIYI